MSPVHTAKRATTTGFNVKVRALQPLGLEDPDGLRILFRRSTYIPTPAPYYQHRTAYGMSPRITHKWESIDACNKRVYVAHSIWR